MVRRVLRWYGRANWGRVLYALVSGPLAVLGVGYLVVAIVLGAGLSITSLGLPWLAAGVVGARGPATVHRRLLRGLLGVTVPRPHRFRPAPGVLGWVRSGLADTAGWRAALYLFAKFPLAVAAFGISTAFWVYGLISVSFPVWWRLVPASVSYDSRHRPHRASLQMGDFFFNTWPHVFVLAGAGVVLLLAAPWVTRAVLIPERLLAQALLGPTRGAELRETRALAVDDSAAAMRRIERDLHDGAQAQLVAVAMKLGMAKDELTGGDPKVAMALVDTAHRGAKDALAELRSLARGIHPPVLDNGLAPALETLTARSAVPVELCVDLPERPSAAIEAMAYFCAAELLANVAKHSGARRAVVTVTAAQPGWLRLVVRDDGVGGAWPGGGLSGLADRVRTVDGRMDVASPPDGPTVVTVELPVRA